MFYSVVFPHSLLKNAIFTQGGAMDAQVAKPAPAAAAPAPKAAAPKAKK